MENHVFENLGTRDVVIMEYRLPHEAPIWLTRVGGFGNRTSFHPPELCLVGSNYKIIERAPLTVFPGGRAYPVMQLVTAHGDQRFESWYWFTANDKVTRNYYQQQFWIVVGSMRRQPVSGTLVRISTPLDDPAAAPKRLLAFLTSWEGAMPAGGRHGS